MMDELELLKKDWQRKEQKLPKLSYNDIYGMILKKSSSVVKWIFMISIAEFAFWILMAFLPLNTEETAGSGADFISLSERILEIISFVVIIYFVHRFYRNYKKISVTDSAKELMKKIIDTRRTVMRYVWFNLGLFAISFVVILVEILVFDPPVALTERISSANSSLFAWMLVGVFFLMAILFFGVLLWLFYRLLYGILLKRLNENYRELKKMEV